MEKYTNENIKLGKEVADFLPPPDKLVFYEPKVKITLELSKRSIRFFKNKAKENHVSYQRMIRSLVDAYVDEHQSV